MHVADAYTFGHELSEGLYRYLGYVVELGGQRIYHAGDTLDHPRLAADLREIGVDVALLPINGRDPVREAQDLVGNLDHLEALDLAARSGASTVVPMHHDMFAANLGPIDAFRWAAARYGELRVVVAERGTPVQLPARVTPRRQAIR